VSTGPASFFYHSDLVLNLRNVLVRAGEIDTRSIWDHLDERFERLKLAIGTHVSDAESSLKVVRVDFLKGLENLWDCPIRKVIHRRETDSPAQR